MTRHQSNHVIDFKKFDLGHNAEDEANLEAWVALCDGIERNELGNTMKDDLVRLGIVTRCTAYIKQHSPPTTQVSHCTSSTVCSHYRFV